MCVFDLNVGGVDEVGEVVVGIFDDVCCCGDVGCGVSDGGGKWVGVCGFEGGGEGDDFFVGVFVSRYDGDDFRFVVCEGVGFVECDGVDGVELFEGFVGFDDYIEF